MSEFVYFRYMSHKMLTKEEEEHKEEIIAFTEDVLQARGIECDSRISKISEEQLKEILEEVRQLRKKKKNKDREEQLDVTIQ
jgi:ribosomal protein S13